MIGVGYRRDMQNWDLSKIQADFFEVVPENWIKRDRTRMYQILESGRKVRLHGVSLNLGGFSEISKDFLIQVKELYSDLGADFYSDHLASSGDAHQLYDLFPIPFTWEEVKRVSDRILYAQDVLGFKMAIENSTYYTNYGEMNELEFLSEVAKRADCAILFDVNNVNVNHKNHNTMDTEDFANKLDIQRVSYMHVAGHEFSESFGMYIDTHSCGVEEGTAKIAAKISKEYGKDILLEWDNDVPNIEKVNQEISCLRHFTTM